MKSTAPTLARPLKTRKYRKRDYSAFIYLAPWLIGFLALQLYPFVISLVYSFTDYKIGRPIGFVGLKNYIDLFTIDPDFLNSLKVTLLYAVITVPGKIILALLIALLCQKATKAMGLVRVLYYIPSLFSGSVAVALLWKIMFMDNGVINSMLVRIGGSPVSWLGDTHMSIVTICMLEVWQFGSSMVMILAALKQVPASLYEAAAIDGAGKVRSFFSITLPQITPIIFFNIIMQTITALQNYTSPAIVTNGGPMKSTYVLGMKIYNEGFSYFKMGYACSVSWVMFLIIMVITLLLFRSSSAWVFYSDEK